MKANRKIIITIDGWSSYVHIDSGAMYRAITLFFLRNHIDWTRTKQVDSALDQIILSFEYNSKSRQSEIHLNDENVEYVIRDLVVAEKVSDVAALGPVRHFAVEQQRKMGAKKGIVMDGRDIGTTVFPQAELFMTADKKVRIERRFRELYEKNPNITIEEVRDNLEMRDFIDSHREISPLRQAEDAIVLDNTNLTEKQQFELTLQWARESIEGVKH